MTAGSVSLREWRERQGPLQTQELTARQVDAYGSIVISRLERGATKPGRRLAAAIERLTGGAVSVASWDVELAIKPARSAGVRCKASGSR